MSTEYPIAMAYVPIQAFANLYSFEEALAHGTVFRDLDLPFLGKGGDRNGGS